MDHFSSQFRKVHTWSVEKRRIWRYIDGMNVVLPERVEAKLSPQEALLDLAVGMYSSGRVTMGTAAEVAGLSVPEFQRELGRRRIPVNYTSEDLAYDLRASDELAGR